MIQFDPKIHTFDTSDLQSYRKAKNRCAGCGKVPGIGEIALVVEFLLICDTCFEKRMQVQKNTCPQCNGKIHVLGKGARFCLDCNWDEIETDPAFTKRIHEQIPGLE